MVQVIGIQASAHGCVLSHDTGLLRDAKRIGALPALFAVALNQRIDTFLESSEMRVGLFALRRLLEKPSR
jgi:hypothetical protein